MTEAPKKSLGQHWLNDQSALESIAAAAKLSQNDTVLEVGPGQGSLTAELVKTGAQVKALELDRELVEPLKKRFANDKNCQIIEGDVLKLDFGTLPAGYKLVANIPYYITGHLLRILSEPTTQKPQIMVLLVQKEVAERVAARPGQMSILSVAMQLSYDLELGMVVPAKMFTPPPKVDSQVLIFKLKPKPLFPDLDFAQFMRIVKAGFSGKRKTLRNALSGGLQIDKQAADSLLTKAKVDPQARAQNLSLDQWHQIYQSSSMLK